MKKTLIISAVVVSVVVALGFGVYYFSKQSDENAPFGGAPEGSETQGNKYIGEDFTVEQIPGWTVGHVPGTLVSFHNYSEEHPDGSPAAKLNFKSYSAVSFSDTNSQTLEEIYEMNINQLVAMIPSTKAFDVKDETINGLPSKLAALELNQQGVDYTILLAVYLAGDKYYVMSFNTTKEKWPEYKDQFYVSARSFEIK